jgi:hypothetical protein
VPHDPRRIHAPQHAMGAQSPRRPSRIDAAA